MLFLPDSIECKRLKKAIASQLSVRGIAKEETESLANFVAVMVANGKSMDELDQELEEILGSLHDTTFAPWIFDNLEKLIMAEEGMIEEMEDVKEEGKNQRPRPLATSRLFTQALSQANRRERVEVSRKTRLERMEKKRESESEVEETKSVKRSRAVPYTTERPSRTREVEAEEKSDFSGWKKNAFSEPVLEKSIFVKPSHLPTLAMATAVTQKICTYWPNCARPNCHFFHPPVQMCSHGLYCTNPHCPYQHPEPQPCKFGYNCQNPNCVFSHPEPVQPPPCKFGQNCKNPNCTFFHPFNKKNVPCRFDGNCTNKACPFQHSQPKSRHMSQRFFATDQVEESLATSVSNEVKH